MAEAGRPFPLQDYLAQSGWVSKCSWCAKFTVDEECAWLSVQEEDAAKKSASASVASGYMYLWDVAKLNGMVWNAKDESLMETLLALVEGCATQEADTPGLRKR